MDTFFSLLSPDDQHAISQINYTGQCTGQPIEDIQVVCKVLLAIHSGDVALPWPQGLVESFLSDPATYLQVCTLIQHHPSFVITAANWFDLRYA